jgi:SAM-dependent methyltransferase
MKMEHKAAINRAFELFPAGRLLRRYAQNRRGLTVPLAERLPAYRWHLEVARKYGAFDLSNATAYEFGAGRDLSSQIMLWCCGVPRQIVVDRERLLDEALINQAMRAIAKLDEPSLCRRPEPGMRYHDMGIEYHAPADARNVPLPDGSIDLILSSNTLEHIPAEELLPILNECRRLCSPGGVVSMAIDYSDHYSHSDKKIGRTNFLRYSDRDFKRFQSSFLYQNRLRHSDYRRLFERSGLIVRDEWVIVEPEDVEDVMHGPVAERFSGYAPEDAAARHGTFALVPG